MSVKDMIKKSVLESGVFDQYNISSILVALVAALALGILIFLGYRRFYTGVIYSRTFAVTLVGMRSPQESRQEPECMCWRLLRQQL